MQIRVTGKRYNSLKVVEIMGFIGRQEGQMVTTVGHKAGERPNRHPHPHRSDMGARQQRTGGHGQQVGHCVLQRVHIEVGHGEGGGVLVVALVDRLVKEAMMK